MSLNIQIYSFIYSFLFGIIFNILLDLFNKMFGSAKVIKKSFFSMIFVLVMSICYFIGLLLINNGVLHIYFILCLMLGASCGIFCKRLWLTHKEKNNYLSNEKIVNRN